VRIGIRLWLVEFRHQQGHAMNHSLQENRAARIKFAPVPATQDLAVSLPGDHEAADDEDWLEFLSLGARIDPADAMAGSGWRHAPVLLSY